MSIRSQRFIINPSLACPNHLRAASGRPMSQISFDLDDVARCAWNEILQTAPRSTSLFTFFEDLLAPGPNLVWREKGLGRGTEMRRSFSGMFGRFFARAYLQIHHDFVWFAAIDGDMFHLSPNWRVRRKPGSKTEMPDWICARPGELVIGEAKGSHQKGSATRGGIPGPVKTAEGQIRGVRVEKRIRVGSRTVWRPRRVKGWAVMSRWGTENPPRDPFLYALDPETEGKSPTPDEIGNLVQAVARTSIEQTALGLGLLKTFDGTISPRTTRRIRLAGDDEKRVFAGVVITPFGPLDMDFNQAAALSSLFPDPHLVRFVGLDDGVLTAYLEGRPLSPRQSQRIGDDTLVGGDGLVVAPIKRIIDLGYQSGQS